MFGRKQKKRREAASQAGPTILDAYVTKAPTAQSAVDIFAGEWVSRFPEEYAALDTGELSLCHDPRIAWGLDELGGVRGESVLEIGPLEAGHSYMLEQAGAASVCAVESNTRAYLKCLVFKEIVGLTRTRFLLGDALEHLRSGKHEYGFVLASGVLYHMRNPVEFIELISQATDRVLLWTHYFDAERIAANPAISSKFSGETDEVEHGGFRASLHRQDYTDTLADPRFCGGGAGFSQWMKRDAILDCLRHFGFDRLKVEFEEPEHGNGPCFSIAAARSPRQA